MHSTSVPAQCQNKKKKPTLPASVNELEAFGEILLDVGFREIQQVELLVRELAEELVLNDLRQVEDVRDAVFTQQVQINSGVLRT